MSSLKMTFSLTSLIFLIALGLVFAPMSVMAHDNADGTTTDTPRPHSHPLLDTLQAKTEPADATDLGTTVNAHNTHPVGSIAADASNARVSSDGTMIVIEADKAATATLVENMFTLIVDFDQDVNGGNAGGTETTITAADVPNNADFTVGVYNAASPSVVIASAVVGSSAPAAGEIGIPDDGITRATDDNSKFEMKIYMGSNFIPNGTDGDALKELTFHIRLNRNAVFGLNSAVTDDPSDPLSGTTAINGSGNGPHPVPPKTQTFTLVKELPKAPDTTVPKVTITAPKMLTTEGKAVFTIAFDDALATTGLGQFTFTDLGVSGGAATASDLQKMEKPPEDMIVGYTLTVTPVLYAPPDEGVEVSVWLRPDSVTDDSGNIVSADTATAGAVYDTIRPRVIASSAAPHHTDPDDLVFTFTFSEPVTFMLSAVDQGNSHNATFYTDTRANGPTAVDPRDTVWVLRVGVPKINVATTILLKAGPDAVSDKSSNANGLAQTYTVSETHTAPDNDPPIFVDETLTPVPDDKQGSSWCEEQNRGNVRLPKAKDTEGQSLVYSLSPNERGHSLPENPTQKPASGLYWVTIDTETRYIQGTAEYADRGTYTWTVTDPDGATDTMEFTINVKPHQPPEALMKPEADKVNSASESDPTENRVRLSWNVPRTKDEKGVLLTDWDYCIPPITHYTVSAQKYNEVMREFEAYTLEKSRFDVGTDVTTYTENSVSRNRIALEKLPKGIYQFKVTVHNKSTLKMPVTDWVTWKRTGGDHVIVADAPAAPLDVRAAIENGVDVTVNWIKVPDYRENKLPYEPGEDDGGAPIYDDLVTTRADYQDQLAKREMYYGNIAADASKDFGGYVVYQVNQANGDVVRYPATGTLNLGKVSTGTDKLDPIFYDHPTLHIRNLAAGEYVFRVTAKNVAGESPRSLSTPHAHVRVVTTTTPPPPVGGLPTNKVVNAEYNPSTGTTSLRSAGTLAPNDFAVINASALPDIQRFFAEGGTISVLNTGGTKYDLAISEIMWGLNLAKAIGAGRKDEQFIELYNTTATAIPLSTVTLVFDKSQTNPTVPTGKVLLDQISNIVGGWQIKDAPGQDGSIVAGGASLISMYRTIEYEDVVKTHNATDAKKNREAQLASVKDGNALAHWAKSNVADTYGVNRIGSPGKRHFKAFTPLATSTIDRGQVIINEIGNHSDDTYDWVELRNVSDADVNLKKWELSQVTGDATTKKDTQLVSFPDNDNHKILAGGVLLIVNSDPYRDTRHPIAAGARINGGGEKTGTTAPYYVDGGLKLANSGDTLLILRNANDKEGKAEAFKDVVGTLSIKDDSSDFRTNMWPLAVTGAAHGNVIENDKDNKEDDFRSGKVYKRLDTAGGTGEKDWSIDGYTGVGYKRSAANNGQNGGTPGYASADVKVNVSDLASNATVTISEIMYAKGRNLPQWIELYNSSRTQPVNISEWKLRIDNLRSDGSIHIRSPSVTTNNFGGGVIIHPNQTVLIVSGATRRDSRSAQGGVDFPDSRVVDLWGQKDRIEVDSDKNQLSYKLLSETAFTLTLMDKGGAIVDTVGNLDTDRETILWNLPSVEEMDDGRSSIIRRTDGDAKADTADDSRDGMMERAWILASETNRAEVRFNHTYYGNSTDIGTPGYRGGGPLPVSLSKFRPERLDTGEIVIRWITESELNNAGFNILRSEKRDGEFTKVHFVAGKGTTTERSTYEWKDTTAKPNVVYYYQIQDISLDGKVTTLRQSRLKGDVTAAGKATTTWGEIKALQ